ncbi:hypothetical protein EHEL_090560 [Encephalitozoon hellem ATCC 50504]|uniref:Exportin-1 n=1 Tax=Encephalitozoon hellem TaxID=27973 RepID=A0A9Q9C597_ENCHE|nr:uncharacterized protein EHEL_090560 [Encephalitozoon hellem ATCC 50504]AFM98951.1 hypothetical protein EHEL_090560 [Encephalitozoon hellem ATCC 50504]UTX43965.1 putative exportin-1 [Encephalitozoon hellem]|eukprot:XP_003887932.1 hypothetical protein EHEL_090560 [Encephalitozoon hellem ATCC 50504]
MKGLNGSSEAREDASHDMESEKMELLRLKQENMKLTGEIVILRQNMIALEKQNFAMKEQKSRAALDDLRRAEKLKKEVDVLRIESRIRENQSRVFKRHKGNAEIDVKWALAKSGCGIGFSLLPFEFGRLKFLKDFFYSEFCQLDSSSVIREMSKKISRFKEFLDFYILFSCKAEVFKEFFCMVLMNPLFPEEKIKLFNTLPLDWLLNFNDEEVISLVKEYIDKNYMKMAYFLLRVAEERPFLLNILIGKEMFSELARMDSRVGKRLVSEICKKGGLSLVDHTNIHYISQENLKVLYKDLYFEVYFDSW